MSEEKLRQAAKSSELMGDLYSLKQYLFESDLPIKVFYLQRQEGSFVRPSFLIKLVSTPLDPYNQYMAVRTMSVMVQFFTEDMFEAYAIGDQVSRLLWPNNRDLILPKYNFTGDEPKKIPLSERMGVRVDPETISVEPFEEPDGGWNVPITFTMRSPVLSNHEGTLIEAVELEKIIGPDTYIRTGTTISGEPGMEAESV